MAYAATDREDDEDEGSLFLRKKAEVIEDRRAASEQYQEIDRDFDFYEGGDAQWEAEDVSAMEAEGKPHTSFNFVQPSVSAVNGMEVSNRQEVNYKPRTTQTPKKPPTQGVPGEVVPFNVMAQATPGADDRGPAELYTAGAKYFRQNCDAEDEESDAFQDTTICGMGWTETRIDFEENPQGDMMIDRCDPGEMGWDCRSKKRNLVDARRLHRVREMDKRAAEDMFPGYECEEIDASWARPQHIDTDPHDREAARNYDNDPGSANFRKTVTVVEVTWFEVEQTHDVVMVETGEIKQGVSTEKLEKIRERAKQTETKIAVRTQKRRVYKQAFLGNSEILGDDQEGTLCQSQKGFKWKCMTGTRARNKHQWMGIVRAMRDPQRWANALYSSTLWTVMTSGKGIMAERDAFEKPQEAEAQWSSSQQIVFLKTGALSGPNPKIMPKTASQLPAGIEKLMEFAIAAMRGVSGVNLETLGAVDREQAASLEYQRRQAATTILAPFFDGLRRYRKEQGRLMLDLIDKYMADGRLIRIAGPDYEEYVPLLRDPNVTEYDIIVDESPSSPNQKEATWATINQILPVVGKNMGPKTTVAFLKASPLSTSAIKEIQDATEQDMQAMANQPPPPEVQQAQLQMQMDQQKHEQQMMTSQQTAGQNAAKANADITLKGMEITLKEREIEMARITSMADLQMRSEEIGFKRQDMEGKAKADEAKRSHEIALRQLETDATMEQEGMKTFSKDLPELIAQMAAQNQALTQAITMLAQATLAPRVTELPDPVTGQTMRAVSRVQQQGNGMVN